MRQGCRAVIRISVSDNWAIALAHVEMHIFLLLMGNRGRTHVNCMWIGKSMRPIRRVRMKPDTIDDLHPRRHPASRQ